MSDLEILVWAVSITVYLLVCKYAARKQKLFLSVMLDDVISDPLATSDNLERAWFAYRFFDKSWFWLVCALAVPFVMLSKGSQKISASKAMQDLESECFKLAIVANPLTMIFFIVWVGIFFIAASLWRIFLVVLALLCATSPAYATSADITGAATRASSTPQYVLGRLIAHHQR
ncbi:TPA: hypothetical protein ACSP88_003753 [Aeromonas hydrophila]